MHTSKVTPKDFFLWAGAMVAFYWSIYAFIALVFSYLDYVFPDSLVYYVSDPYASGVSYSMASLVILVPVFLILMRFIRAGIVADPTRADIWVRRWALYLTLFIAATMIVGDLVTLLKYFFDGDITLRFLLKVVVILLVAGAGFLHFLADLQGFWVRNLRGARVVGLAAGILVVATIVAGFLIIGTPWQAREYRYDTERVSHLQGIQSEIINYWRSKEVLPKQLPDLNNSLSGFYVLSDPKTNEAYEYRVISPLTFELCATFAASSRPNSLEERSVPVKYPAGEMASDTWYHDAGRTCFTRVIDRDLYPPYRGMDIR
jgi:hypothetical protein